MSYELDPIAGQWYRHIDKGQLFRVVSIDEDDDLIQIQYFDGDLEELDSESWFTMDLDLTETPEDWTGPVDDVETDDLGYSETEMKEADWRAPLETNKKPREGWEEDEDEDEKDDWDEGESTEELYGSEP
jgi:hypothetical protein